MLSLLLFTSLALAEDPVFAGTEEGDAAEKPVAKATAEFGGAWTSGNSDFYTLSAGLNTSYKWKKSRFGLVGGAIVGKGMVDADGNGSISDAERTAGRVENARRYFTDARYDLFIGKKQSLYLLAGAFVDPFAGYDLRSHEQFGYSRQLVDTETTKLVGELGIDYAQENYVDGVDPGYQDIIAARVMLGGSHKFTEATGIEDTLEVYENLLTPADVRILNTFAFVSSISDKMSLKLSHNLIFDNVPVEGFRTLDQTTMVTLVATLL